MATWQGKVACDGFANLVCTVLLSSSGQFQWKVWVGQWDSVPVNFLVHSLRKSVFRCKFKVIRIRNSNEMRILVSVKEMCGMLQYYSKAKIVKRAANDVRMGC